MTKEYQKVTTAYYFRVGKKDYLECSVTTIARIISTFEKFGYEHAALVLRAMRDCAKKGRVYNLGERGVAVLKIARGCNDYTKQYLNHVPLEKSLTLHNTPIKKVTKPKVTKGAVTVECPCCSAEIQLKLAMAGALVR